MQMCPICCSVLTVIVWIGSIRCLPISCQGTAGRVQTKVPGPFETVAWNIHGQQYLYLLQIFQDGTGLLDMSLFPKLRYCHQM